MMTQPIKSNVHNLHPHGESIAALRAGQPEILIPRKAPHLDPYNSPNYDMLSEAMATDDTIQWYAVSPSIANPSLNTKPGTLARQPLNRLQYFMLSKPKHEPAKAY